MKKNIAVIIVSVLLIAGVARAATYVGQNIYTDGSLTVLGDSIFHGGVEIRDTGYLRLPVITTDKPDKDDCKNWSDVGKVVVRDRPGASGAMIYVCVESGTYGDGVTPFFEWVF